MQEYLMRMSKSNPDNRIVLLVTLNLKEKLRILKFLHLEWNIIYVYIFMHFGKMFFKDMVFDVKMNVNAWGVGLSSDKFVCAHWISVF